MSEAEKERLKAKIIRELEGLKRSLRTNQADCDCVLQASCCWNDGLDQSIEVVRGI